MLSGLGLSEPGARGLPDPASLARSRVFQTLRLAYQHWRVESGALKVLPTFVASVVSRELSGLDVLPDQYLRADQISAHLQQRRIDLMISSSLDLAGELIMPALTDSLSPFRAVPLFEEPVLLALNPGHPLVGLPEASPEDCLVFPSGAYPEGLAPLAEAELRPRGLWRIPSRRSCFDVHDWMLGMRNKVGLCYRTSLLLELIPESQELIALPLAQPLLQTTYVLMLNELADHPMVDRALEQIRSAFFRIIARSRHATTRL